MRTATDYDSELIRIRDMTYGGSWEKMLISLEKLCAEEGHPETVHAVRRSRALKDRDRVRDIMGADSTT